MNILRPKFKILRIDDMSHRAAKRYSAHVALADEMSQEQVLELIPKINRHIKTKGALQEVKEKLLKGRPAHVITSFIYASEEDYEMQMAGKGITWICRSQWIINKDFPFAPKPFKGETASDGSVVEFG